jgi:hypothetical protein
MPSRLLTLPARVEFPPQSSINRRVAVRYPGSRSTSSRVAGRGGAKARRAKIRDISLVGVALILSFRLKIGARLLIQFSNEPLEIAYDVSARVVHASSQPRGRWIIGCEFARELSPLELETLL